MKTRFVVELIGRCEAIINQPMKSVRENSCACEGFSKALQMAELMTDQQFSLYGEWVAAAGKFRHYRDDTTNERHLTYRTVYMTAGDSFKEAIGY